MSFANLYYKRTVATQRACYVCSRPTATVLATKDSIDFLYTCDGHLKDPGFATALENGDGASGVQKPVLSEEEIRKVKEEYEEKQRRRREKEKEKEKEKESTEAADKGKDKEAGKDKDKDKEVKFTVPQPSQSPSPSPSPSTATPHQRYSLHREMFAMRQGIHRKRRQTTQAKEVAPRLPSAPRGSMSVTAPPSQK